MAYYSFENPQTGDTWGSFETFLDEIKQLSLAASLTIYTNPTMPTTVQLTDRLDDIIDSTWNDVVELLKTYFVEHGGDLPCRNNDLDYSGAVTEIIDSAVPIYTSELNELAYFHHDAAIAALVETFGSADGDWPSGTFAAGLYQLIDNGINEKWHEEAEDLWQEWTDLLDDKAVRQFALSAWSAQQTTLGTDEEAAQ